MMMANPTSSSRRNSNYSSVVSSGNSNPFQTQTQTQTQSTLISSLKYFLKKPHAFPFLLTIFVLLTWVSLRLQFSTNHFSSSSLSYSSSSDKKLSLIQQLSTTKEGEEEDDDHLANVVRFPSSYPSPITKDNRGWLLNPLSLSLPASISGGALTCASVHLGEIRPGSTRGNHRHHTCNETFLIWGAKTTFRLENSVSDRGYAQVTVGADEVAVAASPAGTAHALVNIDPLRSTFFMGCQDSIIDYNISTTDFNVWKDL